ncbi:ABC-2 type transport system permease protein [Salinibacillus kushneri]|uniref:ABC-2 type transport system permease protein n=1 Tax=Salinibacillus kushneri TaxID=237682 RepID=A0A1I0GJQ5_9BACI|nr:ABC transporter permease subunit [Salinibacillus kushneri]SET71437.1 ABC-2 type transport system permease protein [Salinibacillus kushneri]
MQWSVIFKREMMEYVRSIKWIWVPIVFFIFGIMDQITMYYLPKIIDATGGMPEGAEVNIPSPPPAEALFMSINEMNTLGILIIGLLSMSLIAGELKSGVYELVLSKPVKYANYVTAKWAALSTLVLASFFIGLLAGWYYTNILFGELAIDKFLVAFLVYGLYLLFFITIAIFVNTWFKRPGMVLFLSILLIIFVNIITSILGHFLTWSPGHISSYVSTYLFTGNITTEMWGTIGTTIVLIIGLLYAAVEVLKRKEL